MYRLSHDYEPILAHIIQTSKYNWNLTYCDLKVKKKKLIFMKQS